MKFRAKVLVANARHSREITVEIDMEVAMKAAALVQAERIFKDETKSFIATKVELITWEAEV